MPFDRRDDRCPARVRRTRRGFQPAVADDPLREAKDAWGERLAFASVPFVETGIYFSQLIRIADLKIAAIAR